METTEKFRKILGSHARNMTNYAMENKILYLESNEMPDKVVKKIRQCGRQYVDEVRQLYKQGVEEGVFKDFDPSLAEHFLYGACNWVTMWYSTEKNPVKPETVVETLVELLCRAGHRLQSSLPHFSGNDGIVGLCTRFQMTDEYLRPFRVSLTLLIR